jgi:GT2 family glycosyltransferase
VNPSTGNRVEAGDHVSVSIVIVTWNVCEHVLACLDSLMSDPTVPPYEIIIVDNASTDNTREMVPRSYPNVQFIRLDVNRGFPAANNIAIRRAHGKYVLLLNPDTLVHDGCIRKCIEAMDSDSRVGMVGCKLVGADGSLQYECAANLPSLMDPLLEAFYLHMLFPANRLCGRLRMSYWDHETERFVPRISGAFMLLRSQAITRVGPLDERIFMYYEDLDYCARMVEAGYLIRYVPNASITHFGGASSKQSKWPLYELAPAVRYTYFMDHKGAGWAWVYRVLCGLQSIARLVIALGVRTFTTRESAWRRRSVGRAAIHWYRLLWSLGVAGAGVGMAKVTERAGRA